jgi:dTDP-4-dehydrorhamnose 3,5-epimerase
MYTYVVSDHNLKVQKTSLDGVLEIFPLTNFEDFRGNYLELYNFKVYNNFGINQEFLQDDLSFSRKNVLRGVHGDNRTWKLVSCISGSIYLLVVNNDRQSTQFKKWESFTLSFSNYRQILVPPNFGIGHLVLSSTAIFYYKQSTEYHRESQFTIKWDDPKYKFWWPISKPITSIRDQS